MKVLVTCPPMLGMLEEFTPYAEARGLELVAAAVTQTLTEDELVTLVPGFDAWIIGDDPATRRVLTAARDGGLRAAVKWGVGVDNVDFAACRELGIPVTNTPRMFGGEVADVALGYVIGLARELFVIDRGIRFDGTWPKPPGISLAGKQVGLVGLGDVGRQLARRLLACEMHVTGYDPMVTALPELPEVSLAAWPDRVGEMDFLVFTCALTAANRHMLNAAVLEASKPGVRVVNVARGPLIDEAALTAALAEGRVAAAALDVFEVEPLPVDSPLRHMDQVVFGSHNASNTRDAVRRASRTALDALLSLTGSEPPAPRG